MVMQKWHYLCQMEATLAAAEKQAVLKLLTKYSQNRYVEQVI